MIKTRTLIGLTITLALLAIPTTSALAQFSGKEGTAKAGSSVLQVPGGSVECKELTSPYLQQGKPSKDDLDPAEWNECTATAGIIKEKATLTCKFLQFESPEKEGTETGKATTNFEEDCIVKTEAGCEVTIPATANQKLGKTTLKKEGSGVLSIVELTGITAKVNAMCTLAGVKSTEEGKLKIPTLKQSGLALL
jgi:hypothetical protein